MRTAAFLLLVAGAAWAQTPITGTVQYQDKTYNSSGFTGAQPYWPVRQADVEIVLVSNGSVLGSGTTNESGTYSIGGIADSQSVFPRIYARSTQAAVKVVVKDTNSSAIYTVADTTFTTGAANNSRPAFNIAIFANIAPVFNILDMGVFSFQYLVGKPGWPPASVPTLTFFWASGSTNGTFYSKSQNAVFLLGKSTDTDEYDDDVILHEVGHFFANNLSKDDSPGGSHTIIDLKDVRFAWSEGWAHYWSSTVRRFAGVSRYATPEGFVDTFGAGASFFEIEIPSLSSQTITAMNEIAVAAGLWDMTDANNEATFDTLSGNENEIWQALLDVKTRAQVSLEDFRAVIASGLVAALFNDTTPDSIFKNRKVRYYADDSEPNPGPPYTTLTFSGSPPKATQTVRTIFGTGDEDWYEVSLSAGTVQAETQNLKDGCDTVLDFYDSSGTLLASNDDRAPSGDKSSLVNLQIASPGTYRIRVRAFSGADAITEHGYYDVVADNQANALPTIASFSSSSAGNETPFRVTFSASATDLDGLIHLYEWDFDGDGKYDFASIAGGTVTHTYDLPGTFLATLRVTDNKGGLSYRTATVTATTTSSPFVVVTPSFSGTTAPATVTYTIDVSGTIPVGYEWDFEGDGIVDAASTVTNSATTVYRRPTAVAAVGTIVDRDGRRFRATSQSITIQPGTGAPTVSFNAGATSVIIPGSVSFTVTTTGSPTKYEWDFDGDGRYDLQGTLSTVSYPYQRAGKFTPRVRVTNAAGLGATATTSLEATHTTATGWLLEPRDQDRIAGNSVTLTAESVPAGQSKKVRFQYRTDNPQGPWIDIGSPITSTGTRFSVVWDVTGFVTGSVFDLRVLIDDTVSSGDLENVVSINPFSFHISESGSVKDRVIRALQSTLGRTASGLEVFVPYGAMTSSTDVTMRIESATAPASNGSALELTRTSIAARLSILSGSTAFQNAFLLRLPIPAGVDASTLEIHRFDDQAGVWRRDFPSTVRHDEGTVEVRATTVGLFALFSRPAASGDGGGGSCFATVAHERLDLTPWILLAILWLCFSRSKT